MADLQNILAVLAAQQSQGNNATPNPPPPVPGQQYPTQYTSPPPGSQMPYGLPQPISSGSVDLAGIKPVSSGSVSIADAMAKAREFASDKSYDPRCKSHTLTRRQGVSC